MDGPKQFDYRKSQNKIINHSLSKRHEIKQLEDHKVLPSCHDNNNK